MGWHLDTNECQSSDINYYPVIPWNEMLIQGNLWQVWQAVMIRLNNTSIMEWTGNLDGTAEY